MDTHRDTLPLPREQTPSPLVVVPESLEGDQKRELNNGCESSQTASHRGAQNDLGRQWALC